MFWLSIMVGVFVGGLIAVKRDKSLTIFATALLGALVTIKGFDAAVLGNYYGGAHLDVSVENVANLQDDIVVKIMMFTWPVVALIGAYFQQHKKKVIKPAEREENLNVEGIEMQGAIRLNGKVYLAQPGMPMQVRVLGLYLSSPIRWHSFHSSHFLSGFG